METTFTHRLYKDEYNAELLYQIEHDFIFGLLATDESTEKVLVVAGSLENLLKLSSLMYENDAQKIKSVFPSFVTKEDQERREKEIFMETYNSLRDNLCRMIAISSGTHHKNSREHDLLYDIYVQMMDVARS